MHGGGRGTIAVEDGRVRSGLLQPHGGGPRRRKQARRRHTSSIPVGHGLQDALLRAAAAARMVAKHCHGRKVSRLPGFALPAAIGIPAHLC